MIKTLLDTDILSMLLRQQITVVERAKEYVEVYPSYSFSIITRYEILRGLKVKDARKQLQVFDQFCQASEIFPLTDSVIVRAATIYAELRQRGEPVGDADILIASTALEYDLAVATNNVQHFARIADLVIVNWANPE